MSQRTVTTPEAHQTARDMAKLIAGELTSTVKALQTQGAVLKDTDNWDGGLAKSFTNEVWPSVETALSTMLAELDRLQASIKSVNEGISAAGN